MCLPPGAGQVNRRLPSLLNAETLQYVLSGLFQASVRKDGVYKFAKTPSSMVSAWVTWQKLRAERVFHKQPPPPTHTP